MEQLKINPVVAVFQDRSSADSAIDELWHAGFPREHIGILVPGEGMSPAHTAMEPLEDKAAAGTTKGAVAGGVAGAVAGAMAVSLVPGMGPVLAGVALGAAAGAALGTFAGPFVALGLSEEEAHRLEHEHGGGKTIVVVRTDEQPERVVEILHSHGGTIRSEEPISSPGAARAASG
jgi:hypothetical protein